MQTRTTPGGNSLVVFGEHQDRTLAQLSRCVDAAEGALGVECADGHVGYSQPIGGVVAYPEHLSPSGVGFDIACGNKAVRTNLLVDDVAADLGGIADTLARTISFGLGRTNQKGSEFDSPFIDTFDSIAPTWQRGLRQLAIDQLGTVGSGNHYVDIFGDEDGYIWVGVHFGSRGLGHKTATHYMELAAAEGQVKGHNDMDAPPLLIEASSPLGEEYIQAMTVAGDYAYSGRDWVVNHVINVLGAEVTDEVHNHHNFAWPETHGDRDFWVVRKGATPAFPGQRGFVGGSMGTNSVILRGAGTPDSVDGEVPAAAEASLFSTVHGAGRVMSRTQAAGKFKRRKKWVNNVRDDDTLYDTADEAKAGALKYRADGGAYVKRIWTREKVRDGVVDWNHVRETLDDQGIILRGGGADEAPEVYKSLDSVLAAHGNTVEVEHRLRPLVVLMAGADVFDPFKD